MRLPNSYGSVYKLSGKRRKPWAARKTVGWKQNEEKKTSYPEYEFIGYYETKKEALQALAAYNENPYDINASKLTFADVYEKWSSEVFPTMSPSNIRGYKSVYNICGSINPIPIGEIKLETLQDMADNSGKNSPTLRRLKILIGLVFDYAVKHEFVSSDRRTIVSYLDISKAGNPNSRDRFPFSKEDISRLWEQSEEPVATIILILIYTGCRISELIDLKQDDVHLDERYFEIRKAKTASGIRLVPIADKIYPFFEYWMEREKSCDNFLCNSKGAYWSYQRFIAMGWKPYMEKEGMTEYTPHCTRHTFISLLTEAGVDERIIQQIVGHKGKNVTQAVYTHIDMAAKLNAVNKI